MNPIVLYMASGESLYAGVLLLLALIVFTPWMTGTWWRRLRMLATWIGLALVVMACPPFHWAFDVSFSMAFVAWLALSGKRDLDSAPLRRFSKKVPDPTPAFSAPATQRLDDDQKKRSRATLARNAAGTALATMLLAAAVLEWPHRYIPKPQGASADHLVVLGDSISAGIAGDDARWPVVFTRLSGIPVKNLAEPGAQLADALAWPKKLDASDTLVLIEIGGNDLIAGTSTADFDRDLDQLLAAIARPGRTLVMFELPLLPHKIGYGISQRRLATKYHVMLIPKRLFVGVIAAGNATSDGLHLSPDGARAMATLVQRALGSTLQKPAPR